MRVLVTGASGLIGSALCDALLARGDEVVGLTRDPERARSRNPTVRWHAWRVTTESPPPEALDHIDGVVNLIGEEINQRLTDQAKVRIRESRLLGTRNLLQGIEASPTTPSVFAGQSAIGYYGDRGGQIASGEQYMSWIHLEDVVGLFLWALDDHRVWGLINATAPHPVTNREFSKALGRALRRPAVMPVPKLAVAALRGGELADAAAGGARVLPRRALDLGYEFRHPELDEALRSALR